MTDSLIFEAVLFIALVRSLRYAWLCHAALYDIKTLSCFVPKAKGEAKP